MLHERNKTDRSSQRRGRSAASSLQGVGDILPLLRREVVGGSGVIALPALVVGDTHELNRGQADEYCPQDRQPATGEERSKADAEQHGWEDNAAGLRKGGGQAAVLRARV